MLGAGGEACKEEEDKGMQQQLPLPDNGRVLLFGAALGHAHCHHQGLCHLRCRDHHHNRLAPPFVPPHQPQLIVVLLLATPHCCWIPPPSDNGDPSFSSSSSLDPLNPIAYCLLHCPPPTLSPARLHCCLPSSNHWHSCCLQKLQHNVRRCKEMKYFIQDNIKRFTLLAPLYDNAKGKEGG